MIDIGKKKYVFDINKIVEFVQYSDKTEVKERELTDVLENNGDGLQITSKVVRETCGAGNPQIDNIKYDIVKNLMVELITFEDYAVEELPYGLRIVVNTMINEGFLKEI